MTGTEGRDVIVTASAGVVDALGGDDLICVTGPGGNSNLLSVVAGAGDDVVDTTALAAGFYVGTVLDGGEGLDGLRLTGGSGDLTLDMARGTFTSSQGTAAFTSFEFSSLEVGTGTVTYRGTEGDDDVTLRPTGGVPTLDVTTGGGDDVVTLEPATAIGAGSRLDTGAGTDDLFAATETGRLTLDLATQRFGVGGVEAIAVGLEDAFLMAPEVVMNGGDDDDLTWNGCDATLRGGLGDDSLRWQFDYVFESCTFDCDGEVSMNGGDGRDNLRGSSANHVLIGGRGHDTIEGRGGDDRVRGSRGNDKVDGGQGRDRVSGGAGNDVLKGRSASDVLIGGPGRDRVDGSNGRDRGVAEREQRCER